VVDTGSIGKLLEILEDYLDRLKALRDELTLEKLRTDRKSLDSAKYDLQVCIQCCIDIGNHLVSSLGLGLPEGYADIFDKLGQFGVITPDFAYTMGEMAKFRNILVHLYGEVDVEKMYNILQNNLGDFDQFSKVIVEFIEKEEKNNKGESHV